MRPCIALGMTFGGILLTGLLSCGGSQPPPKSTEEAKDQAPPTADEPANQEVSEDNPAAEDKPAPSPSESSGQPCSVDTSKEATSKIGTVKIVTGCASPEKSLKLLEQYYPQLHACFTNELKTNKKAKGEVNIKINVGQNGTYSVRVHKDDITSEEFVKCMVGVLEPLPYPKPEFGGATIEFVAQLK